MVESYTIGEYDIVMLSAKESDGLERWLTDNGYKIPKGAAEVLQPYIKSRLKFFVVKVNLENFQNYRLAKLRPIQISYKSNQFMLPIRLGMANAKGDQDMIVYAFSAKGRVETTNYRTVPIPTNWEVPNTLRANFSQFYKSVYDKAWANAGKNSVMLEYAWDLSGIQPVKCDPCNGPPPVYNDIVAAGVDWLRPTRTSYKGSIFMTRLHLRYNRETFPQDLLFQETPNKQQFQGRFVMHQPPPEYYLQCEEAKSYFKSLKERRKGEVRNIAMLTGWDTQPYDSYIATYDARMDPEPDPFFGPLEDNDKGWVLPFSLNFPSGTGGLGLLLAGLLLLFFIPLRRLSRLSRIAIPLTILLMAPAIGQAFCGFYVAKADAKLFNKASAVILARQGTQTVITMSSDFEGDLKDFAMVVPVPTVLKRSQIRLADPAIFDKLDAYSGPRLVEYHDQNPCYYSDDFNKMLKDKVGGMMLDTVQEKKEEDLGVEIVESYTVGEYDILILSADESDGLQTWLTQNGYKIPTNAASVLQPYIKSDMKFFVVKVNIDKLTASGAQTLRPIQMTFRSKKFMLPIRLGMANANGDQDMIVYAFGENGRTETTNYRTVPIPTDYDIPLPVRERFGDFYSSLYDKAWERAGRNSVLLEYAWDLSASNYVKCDPCPTTPPVYTDLREAGLFWITQNPSPGWGGANYVGNAYMTRLHVRYNRNTFPQDLQFQKSPDKSNFQGRYVLRNPVRETLDCDNSEEYYLSLRIRRQEEVKNLVALTGWKEDYRTYITEFDDQIEQFQNQWFEPLPEDIEQGFVLPIGGFNSNWPGIGMGMMALAFFSFISLILFRRSQVQTT